MELVTDVFQHAEDIANGSIGILHSHINYTSFVGYAVKGGMNFYAAFAKLLPDVYRHPYVSPSLVGYRLYSGVKFEYPSRSVHDTTKIRYFLLSSQGKD